MKNNKFLFLILMLISAIVVGGCSKDKDKNVEEIEIIEVPEVPSDPEPPEPPQNVGDFYKSFIGQWQEIARGNELHPELEPDGHIIEFLPNGTLPSRSGDGSGREYRVDAEFLYFDSGRSPDGHTYRYTFSDPDTLRIDYAAGAKDDSMGTPTFHIYKRLK
jgi:hypothetical protein